MSSLKERWERKLDAGCDQFLRVDLCMPEAQPMGAGVIFAEGVAGGRARCRTCSETSAPNFGVLITVENKNKWRRAATPRIPRISHWRLRRVIVLIIIVGPHGEICEI